MVDYIERQCIAREMGYKAKPVATSDESLIQNYEKGIVAGLRLAIALPRTMEELEREQFNMKLEEERSNGSQ